MEFVLTYVEAWFIWGAETDFRPVAFKLRIQMVHSVHLDDKRKVKGEIRDLVLDVWKT